MIATFLVPLLVISILILLNGIFVAAEFAIVTAPRSQLNQMAEQGSPTAEKLLKILNSPHLQNQYITTAQVGITLASLGLGMYGEHAFAEWIMIPLQHLDSLAEPLSHSIATVTSVAFLTYFHVVLGEMIPKSFALQAASTTVLTLYTPLNIADRFFYPIIFLLNDVSLWIVNKIKLPNIENETRLFTPDDLEYIVEESLESGMLEDSDKLFIENILDLEERTAGQIMTPRNRIFAISIHSSDQELLHTICNTTKTRYPIYDRTIDQILGILHIKDLARWQLNYPNQPINIRELLRPVLYIPETLPLSDLLIRFRKEQSQIGFALDEFGGIAGIITLEDIIEEVVGEILDEFDQESKPIEELPGGILRVRGDVILGELEQHYDLNWEESIEANSIGGYIMTVLGEIPAPQDTITIGEVTITVEEVDGRAVKSVLIQLPHQTGTQ